MHKLSKADQEILDKYAMAIASAMVQKGLSYDEIPKKAFKLAKDLVLERKGIIAELEQD